MKICPTCQQTYSDDVRLCPRDGAQLTVQATEAETQIAVGVSRRFRSVRRLGAGGMGAVFLAEQIAVGNCPVALKVLNREAFAFSCQSSLVTAFDDPDFLLRFQNESASTGRIHHPNVLTIYESGQADDGTPCIDCDNRFAHRGCLFGARRINDESDSSSSRIMRATCC